MLPRRSLAALIALCAACTPEPEQPLTVLVNELPLRAGTSSDDPVVATVRVGSPLKGQKPGTFGSKEHWKIRLNDGSTVYAPLSCCAVLGEPSAMVVTSTEATRLKEPYERAQILERVPVGTRVLVHKDHPSIPAGYGLWVEDGFIRGYVPLAQLGQTPPSVDALFGEAKQALLDGDFARAAGMARAALAVDANHAPSMELLIAVLDGMHDPEAASLRKKLPEKKPSLPPATEGLGPNVIAYTTLPLTPARRGPTLALPVAMSFPLNTKLTVKGVDKAWARVAWRGVVQPVSVEIDPFAPPPDEPPPAAPAKKKAPAGPPPAVEVYVPAGYLGPSPVEKKPQRARVQELMASKAWPDAVLAIQQLLVLEPGNVTLLKNLVTAGVESGQFDIAVRAHGQLMGQARSIAGFDVETAEWVFGCKGERSALVFMTDDEIMKAKPRNNVCLRDVDIQPECAPCETWSDDGLNVAMFDRDMMKFRDDGRSRILAHQEAAEARKKARADRDAKLEKLFPDRGFCHVKLRNRLDAKSPEGAKLVVYSVRPGDPAKADERVRTASVKMPAVNAQQFLDVRLRIPMEPGATCGVMNAKSPDAAKKALVASLKGEKKDLPAHHDVTLPLRHCECYAGK